MEKGKLGRTYQKASKYYENDFFQKFVLLVSLLSTTPIVKNDCI